MAGYVPRYHRVYLLDDHEVVRRGLRDLLVDVNDIDVVGESGSAREAVDQVLALDVDVMLLDLHVPDGTGVEVCRAVRAERPSVHALLLTASGDEEALAASVLAGAAGYLVKLSRTIDVVSAVRGLRAGSSLLTPESRQRGAATLRSLAASLAPPLSEAERRVLGLVLDGRTDSEVAAALADEPGAGGTAVDVRALVTRLADVLVGRSGATGEPGGRHRAP